MTTKRLKIIVADPDKKFVNEIRSYLTNDDRLQIIDVAYSIEDLFVKLDEQKPDVLLFEPAFPQYDCYKLVRRLCVLHDPTISIALSRYNFSFLVDNLIELGLQGYLWKEKDMSFIHKAIETIQNGKKYLSVSTQTTSNKTVLNDDFLKGVSLSLYERDVLTLYTRGMDTISISKKFNTNIEEIDVMMLEIMRKLNIPSLSELKNFALRQGLD